ncbi:hypothetical protein GH714_008300 [Hevea brasiliensis]|uniref:Fe2OG dioxygenase domain-containing protein n=1 Tax=Hevea brasiliensis TaxID=3981 RepID=A0A6A6LZN4_HEVBR|nr:hypothetical protein GH714_008300 [Hevea brasiliensis]
MEAYLDANDLWEAVEEDYQVLPLPDNPTMAQMKSFKERKARKSKAKNCLFAAVSSSIFTKIMSLKTAFDIWNYLKKEYEGNEKIKGMQVLNLVREFEMQKMKESETIKEYSDRLLNIVNKDLSKIGLAELIHALQAQEQRRLMRSEGSVEGALAAKVQTNQGGKGKYKGNKKEGSDSSKSDFPPCKHCNKKGHPPSKCWRRPDVKCEKCQKMGHHQKICKSNIQKVVAQVDLQQKNVVQVADHEEEQLFVATCLAARDQAGTIPSQDSKLLELSESDLVDDEPIRGTRSLSEIYQKCNVAVLEPENFQEAKRDPKWVAAMKEEEVSEDYATEMERLAFKLMELIALSLGLQPDRFHGFFKDQTTFIRLNHYPPSPFPHLALGVGRHKDAGGLTILAQDEVGGLEVKRKSDAEWTWVMPTPNSYIINVGDLIQDLVELLMSLFVEVWSNDAYESVEHRVKVNPEKERFSIPYFFNPGHYTIVKPLEEIVNEQTLPNLGLTIGGSFWPTESVVISKSLMLRTSKSITSAYHN